MQVIYIGLMGLLGVFCRFGLDRLFATETSHFPISTFVINILGSLAAGLVYALGERQEISPALQTSLLVGFCGGFTTFSAYTLQTATMIDRERALQAAIYLTLSPLLSLAAAYAPIWYFHRH